ncbi:MAG: ABC transporter permease [Nitrospirae bacterium]|nr:ABC transporter permease [Nitrospirota bacterium]
MILTRTMAIIERDMRKFRRNPVIMVMSVVMPLAYLIILGNSFQGKLKDLPVALVNQDAGQYGLRVTEALKATESGAQTFELTRLVDQGEAVEGVKDGVYKAAVIVPPDFSRRMSLGTGPEVGLFVDNTDQISEAALTGAVTEAINAVRDEFTPIRPDRTRVQTRRVELYRVVDYDQSLVPGIVVMAIFMGAMITGVFNLVMDRFLGTDEAVLLTPVTKTDIVVGLVFSGFFITLVMALLVFVISCLITGIPVFGGLERTVGMFVVMAFTTLGLLSMMFLMLGRASHPRIVGVFSGFMNVIFFFPSGAVYPVKSFPHWLQSFATVNPEYYAVHAMKAMLFKSVPLSVISGDLMFLAGFTLVMMSLAVVTFKRTL